ncbi:MAG: 50S ribosomal protein L6 [Actinobacteria bacterium]|jgi:large subunit ribosomal protein L6|nr:50S ribosomal protein L6 [Actinomycetota bacterium]MCL6104681.1 50S ribosomal protein L6 [Actinomycetota bacterium]
MSRIGRAPISIPAGVKVTLDDKRVSVSGPLGELTRELPVQISVVQQDSILTVQRSDDYRTSRALHGLFRMLIYNMVVGVSSGFTKELQLSGVGYRAVLQSPTKLELSLGFSHTVEVVADYGVSFELSSPTRILVKGTDKEKVGQVAANIRKLRKPEPYKGKGVRYANERVTIKAGKTAK